MGVGICDPKNRYDATGIPLTQEHKDKIGKANSILQQGKGNPQYGTMWITDGKESKKIKKDTVIPEGWNKGRSKFR